MPLAPPDAGIVPRSRAISEPILATLNALIGATACAAAAILLWVASHCESWLVLIAVAVAFSFVASTLFSCLHECVHGLFNPNPWINRAAGVVFAAFFPTGFSLQKSAHLAHHRNNRSAVESFDYIRPGDVRALKFVQWYGIISGVYWVVSVLGWMLYLVLPFLFRPALVQGRWSSIAEHTSGPAYARAFAAAPPVAARAELIFTLSFQATMFYGLDLSVTGWLACYLAFGFSWSALQYADHAYSRLDVVEGAWDLRVNPLVQKLFLNYHLHLAHHRHPSTPWFYLPRYVDPERYRPRFIAQYARMWLGPRRLPDAGA